MNKGNLIISVLLLFVPQLVLVFFDKSWQIMCVFLACSLAIFLVFLQDKISLLKISKDSLEIEMKKAIEEVYATIDDMRGLAEPIINFSFQLMSGEDLVFEGTSAKERIIFFRKAKKIAKSLGIETPELQDSFKKAKLSIIYSFESEIERLWGGDHQRGKELTYSIINRESNSITVDIDKFRQSLSEVPLENRNEAENLYRLLNDFLKETRDL